MLYHHRWPTSTDNVRNACHPFSTKDTFDSNYVMVHNGVVFNDTLLKSEHDKLGIKYVSLQADGRFNDSEALLYDIALYLEGKQPDLRAEGDIAFIVVENKDGKPHKLHFGRNYGSPLYMSFSTSQLSLASQAESKNNASMIDPGTLYTFDYETHNISKKALEIPEWAARYNQRNGAYQSNQIGWTTPTRQSFKTHHTASIIGEDKRTRYWDDNSNDYLEPKDISYGSDAHFIMVYDRGETMAYDLLIELGSVSMALLALNDVKDSLDGKLARISLETRQYSDTSKKYHKLVRERVEVWTQTDIVDAAIDAVEGSVGRMVEREEDHFLEVQSDPAILNRGA